ncbi:MAG: MXAN_6640 family putative metalloprotease [Candidatus Zixiibacteriota bacterium]
MKRTIIFFLGTWAILTISAFAGTMSEQEQQELIDMVNYMRGDTTLETVFDEHEHGKCGTDIALTYFNHLSDFTGEYAAKVAALPPRPILSFTFDSPGGHFKIHYNTSGTDAVYLPGTDVNPADGVPDYVNGIAIAADSAWQAEIVTLGYTQPLSDGTNGGDSKVDIYIENLGPQYYGVTYPDTTGLPYYQQSVAAFLILDNDYNMPPYNSSSALERRLDAARVTIAHEFFHVIHYTLDYTEYETQGTYDALPWWEMTASWMEEYVFDDVDDYYAYIHSYLNYPYQGLRYVFGNTLHQYGACIFPLFLAERWDPIIIKTAWNKCREYGTGTQFMQAVSDAISEHTGGAYNLRTAFNEFAVWNFFTGTRASRTPAGYGFSEASNYYMIPDSMLFPIDTFVDRLIWVVGGGGWSADTLSNGKSIAFFEDNMPMSGAAHYIDLRNIDYITDSLFEYTFSGISIDLSDDYTVDWAITHIGFTSSPTEVAEIISINDTSKIKFSIEPDQYSRIISIPTPVDTTYYADFSKDYGYTLLFNSSFSDTADVPFSISFGPNPAMLDSVDQITFYIRDANLETLGKTANINIDIFTASGEKVLTISEKNKTFDAINRWIDIPWGLSNNGDSRVVPGLYFAYMEVELSDGTTASKIHKIALIK